ncbi:hypothetical protein [Pseudoduganella sp. OTU4001]|uniref:hypothetical protein n=1 Tax=Pseudoduganella sp. OTU4001 TaxID=3043854 RepID=UPI00313E3C15
MRLAGAPLSLRAFAALLALVLLACALAKRPSTAGDFEEYALMTIAIASHGSPDIRPADIDTLQRLAPPGYFETRLATLREGMAGGAQVPLAGFHRGRDGATYAIHFFAFPALAALPYAALEALGANPLKCFQLVNTAAIFVLGLALFRFFGSAARASTALLLFLLCGGLLYWNWANPEILSATTLLAAFLYFASGAPLAGGVLAGVASMQNPGIVLALPALALLRPQPLAALLQPRMLAGLALGLLLFALSPAFNLLKFGTPSIIAAISASPALMSGSRLFSLFFDLNQGMIVAIPGVAAALLLWGWRGQAALGLLCAACTLLLALPGLTVSNWNSGAAGVMRYAFWAAMPLLFLLLHRLQAVTQWPGKAMLALLAVQAGATALATTYRHTSFSPQARWVMTHFPAAYNPEPEIFAERLSGNEAPLDPARSYRWLDRKTLYYANGHWTYKNHE